MRVVVVVVVFSTLPDKMADSCLIVRPLELLERVGVPRNRESLKKKKNRRRRQN